MQKERLFLMTSNLKKLNYLKNLELKVKAMYIFGLPTDDMRTISNTIKYALKLNTFFAQFSVFTP